MTGRVQARVSGWLHTGVGRAVAHDVAVFVAALVAGLVASHGWSRGVLVAVVAAAASTTARQVLPGNLSVVAADAIRLLTRTSPPRTPPGTAAKP